jgi:hypothetical protein
VLMVFVEVGDRGRLDVEIGVGNSVRDRCRGGELWICVSGE